jgi:hypothetical protein
MRKPLKLGFSGYGIRPTKYGIRPTLPRHPTHVSTASDPRRDFTSRCFVRIIRLFSTPQIYLNLLKSYSRRKLQTTRESERPLGATFQLKEKNNRSDARASPFSRAYAPQEGRGAPAAQERDKERGLARKKGGEAERSRSNGGKECLRCSDASKGGSSPAPPPCPSL